MQPQEERHRSFSTLHLRFRCLKAAWRYGVVDSIRGFGSLDPGSNPGTSACFDLRKKKQNPQVNKTKETTKTTKEMIQ
tara:strand:+ start:593 stop:826 length:234 start_codon:yes stop_codon:yes gene_type:complete